MHRAFFVATSALALLPSGCPKVQVQWDDPNQAPFEVQVTVDSDPGVPLPGAELLVTGNVRGTTDSTGSTHLLFNGKEGDRVEVSVRCPADYESPSTPLSVQLRRFAAGSPIPQFEARCPPTLRTVVVGLRVENGPNLPVQYLGRTVAQTDGAGAALFSLRARPAEQIEVTLSTEGSPDALRPQDPKFTFVTKDFDDVVILDQTLTVDKKKPVAHPRPAGPVGPPRPTPLPTKL
jgi:hypothetical protein